MAGEVASGFGAADGLQELRAGGRGLGDNVELLVSPVRGHLAAAGVGVVGGSDRLEELFIGSHADSQTERAIAIVRVEPVVGGLQGEARGSQEGFVSSAGDLEVDFLLALKKDLAIVHLAGGV